MGGVHVGKDDVDLGADGQGIMFGYASDVTEDAMALIHLMATRLEKKLNDVRKYSELWCLRPGRSENCKIYLHGDKSMAVKRQDVDVFCRGVPPPGIDDAGFDSLSRFQQ